MLRLRPWPRLGAFLLAALLATIAACSDGTGPKDTDDDQRAPLAFKSVRVRQGAPALARVQAQFWARFDRDREVTLYFRPRPGDSDSTEFLEFEVPRGALLRDASGRTFAGSDSVLITVTVPDPSRFQVEFSPAGLRFNPNRPAQLAFSLEERDDDLDGDGDNDDDDDFRELDLWRQETPTAAWKRIGSLVLEELEEITADILGFTSYAVAI